MELNKTYDPKATEQKQYEKWEQKGYFRGVQDKNKKPYSIVIPPPNITGQLHMGHALDNMMQDAIIRFKRMQGFSALWVPGTDHASIATEAKIVEQMAKEGLKKEDLGREEFLKRAWDWKEKYGGRIVKQLKKLGSSCDWSRERFTMDEGLSRAVLEAFVRLYEKGYIYRGDRIINWCIKCKTALSDAEVEYDEKNSHLWHILYPSQEGGIVVATTRPETMLGDSAIAVNPGDERYAHLIGKTVTLPLMNREIPVIADDYVDMEFGTGAVKITPAHDPNDFEVGIRHNLDIIRVLNDDGTVNELGGKYCSQDRFTARKNIVSDLEELGLLVKTHEHKHNVGECYRCSTIVEPIVSKQWFVNMSELTKPAIEAVKTGDIKFVSERFEKIYFNWLYNIRDWCISRQLWWGHRIPAYYCTACSHMHVSAAMPEKCDKCNGTEFKQDEDVLDTWFSSGLWPFSTLGWPDNTSDLEYFYPTNVLVTSYDIIFFWVARMIIFGMEFMNEKPFEYICIHGIVRDEQGRKMSKSLNNGIDPLEIIEKYGADALRFSLAMGNSMDADMRFFNEKVESCRNFANKIWNASRFVLMNTDGKMHEKQAELDIADKWILSRLNDVIEQVTQNMEKFELGLAANKIYDFLWNEYCDWYIEMAKPRLFDGTDEIKSTTSHVLTIVLIDILKLLHPFMPFITEEIFCAIDTGDESIMISSFPQKRDIDYLAEETSMKHVMELIREIRNLRAEMNVPPSKRCRLFVVCGSEGRKILEPANAYLTRLAYGTDIVFLTEKTEILKNTVSIAQEIAEVYLPVSELIDIESELKRLENERNKYISEIERVKNKLNNKGFILKAPEEVVSAEQAKMKKYSELLEKVEARIDTLK